jgi:general secretion pathway protein G
MPSKITGFSLIELMVVLAILSVLSMLLMPLAETAMLARQERELKQSLWEIRSAIDAYKRAYDSGAIDKTATSSGYPPNLQALVDGVPDVRPASKGEKLYFLRRIPKDPFAPAELEPAMSWHLRSYASPPHNPKPGADIFDVYPWAKEGVAMDGSRYAEW